MPTTADPLIISSMEYSENAPPICMLILVIELVVIENVVPHEL
jgi:hypothetical protein